MVDRIPFAAGHGVEGVSDLRRGARPERPAHVHCRRTPRRRRRESRDRRSGFSSGEASLDEWLVRFSDQSRRRDTAATWVVADAEDVVTAFVSLSMFAVSRARAADAFRRGAPDPIPSLLIGRLAVDPCHGRLGLGTALVQHALAAAVALNTLAACRAVVVTALNPRSVTWWQRFGFVPLDPDDDGAMDLYLLTKDIEATLRRL